MISFLVEDNYDDIRIDKYLIDELGYSRNKIQKLINQDKVLVNNQNIKNSYIIKENDKIEVIGDVEEEINIKPQKMNLDIYYEDKDIIVVNKPSGMVVHPALGHYENTLVNGLLYHCQTLSKINNQVRPGIVHRIDKDTSGLLLIAKNNETHNILVNQMKKKQVTRKYIALVHGIIKYDKGTIDAPIGRNSIDRKKMAVTDVNSKPAITHFKVLERLKEVTLVECILETGRTHQIRVHMNYIKHPIVNDPMYSYNKIINNFHQMLHAKIIGFYHPKTNEYMEFEAPVPKEFNNILEMYR